MNPRTSLTDPIRVDFLPDDIGLPGRLGMTFAPGKNAPGIAGLWDRDLDADLERLARRYGTRVLVSLLQPHEYDLLRIADLPAAARRHGLDFLELPTPDGGVPPSLPDAISFVHQVLHRLRTSGTVVVHCRGGLGRTGLIAACCLTTVGYEPEDAITIVRRARRNTVETAAQVRFISDFAAEWPRRARLSAPEP